MWAVNRLLTAPGLAHYYLRGVDAHSIIISRCGTMRLFPGTAWPQSAAERMRCQTCQLLKARDAARHPQPACR